MTHNDFEKEPIPGLPARLPQGENILWQGKPDQQSFLRNVMHFRMIAVYFLALAIWNLTTGMYDGLAPGQIAASVAWMVVLGAIVLCMAWWFARAVEKTTIYTITNKRVLMRIGVALPVTFNLPFSQIVSADVQQTGYGTGTIALSVKEHTKISWMVLWPHARPWKLAAPQPAVRTISDVDNVARILADGLALAHGIKPIRVEQPSRSNKPSQPGKAVAGNLQLENA